MTLPFFHETSPDKAYVLWQSKLISFTLNAIHPSVRADHYEIGIARGHSSVSGIQY